MKFKVLTRSKAIAFESEVIYEGYRIRLKLEDGREITISYDERGDLRISQEHIVVVPVVSNAIIIKEDK